MDEPTGFDAAAAGGEERTANASERAAPLRGEAHRAESSHPLRQTRKGPLAGPFFVSRGCVDEPTGFEPRPAQLADRARRNAARPRTMRQTQGVALSLFLDMNPDTLD